LTSRRKSYIST